MFKKKSKSNTAYQEAINNINKDEEKKSSEKIVFKEILTDNDCKIVANNIISNNPAVVNFASISVEDANKHLAFLTGVTYALAGEMIKLREKVFLFAKKEEFLDGSLKQFIDEIDL